MFNYLASVDKFPSLLSANQHAALTMPNYLKMVKINGVCCFSPLQYMKSYLRTISEQLQKTLEIATQCKGSITHFDHGHVLESLWPKLLEHPEAQVVSLHKLTALCWADSTIRSPLSAALRSYRYDHWRKTPPQKPGQSFSSWVPFLFHHSQKQNSARYHIMSFRFKLSPSSKSEINILMLENSLHNMWQQHFREFLLQNSCSTADPVLIWDKLTITNVVIMLTLLFQLIRKKRKVTQPK